MIVATVDTRPPGPTCGAEWDFGPAGVKTRPCGKPATQLVTIRGAGSGPGALNVERQPQCDRCARMSEMLVRRHFAPAGALIVESIGQ